MGEELNSFTLAELLTSLRRVLQKLPGLLWLCGGQRSQQWFMGQRKGVQSVHRELTGSTCCPGKQSAGNLGSLLSSVGFENFSVTETYTLVS